MTVMTRRKITDKNALILICFSVTLFYVTLWLAHNLTFPGWEQKILINIYGLPTIIGPLVYFITQAGSIAAAGVVGLVALLKSTKKVALEIMASGLSAYILAIFAKGIIIRTRPSGIVPGISQRYEVAAGSGFPSGHTAVATALATTLWFIVPKKYRPLLILWVFLVAFSRMYLGLHAPLDIVGGFAIGLFVGVTYQQLMNRYLYREKKKI